MNTIFDWISLLLFSGVIFAFYIRSSNHNLISFSNFIPYAFMSLGCAAFNYLGNNGQPVLASLLLAGLLIAIFFEIRRGAKPKR